MPTRSGKAASVGDKPEIAHPIISSSFFLRLPPIYWQTNLRVQTHANWAMLLVTWFQDNMDSTDMYPHVRMRPSTFNFNT